MRLAGTIPDRAAATRFTDHLRTLGISAQVAEMDGVCEVWVHDEGQLAQGKQELAEFLNDPVSERYRGAARAAEELRRQEVARARQAQRNFVDMRDRWGGPTVRQAVVTLVLLGVSGAVAVWTQFGHDLQPVAAHWFVVDRTLPPGDPQATLTAALARGEVWRLATPMFLHFGGWHLAGNMLLLFQLGLVIESRRGSWRMAGLVLVGAVASTVAQYLAMGPGFGGMSGVNYALFGYAWLRSRVDPTSGMYLTRGTVVLLVAWFFLCMTGAVGPVANVAHAAGLALGMAIGYWPAVVRRR
jgi:GlpG protein